MEKFSCCNNPNCNNCDTKQNYVMNQSCQDRDPGRYYNEPNSDFNSEFNDDFDGPDCQELTRNQPFNPPCNQPYNPPCNKPCNRPFNPPCNKPCNKPFNPPCNQPFNPLCDRPFNPPCDRPFNPPCDRPFNPPCNKPCNQPFNAPCNKPCNQPFNPPCNQPFNQPCDQPCDGPLLNKEVFDNCDTDEFDCLPDPRVNDCHKKNAPCQKIINNPNCDDYISDTFLLNYLLKKYKLDKQKLILSIQKHREKDFRLRVICNFYEDNEDVVNKPFREQYRMFKEWNQGGIYICKEEFENYYDKYIKDLN